MPGTMNTWRNACMAQRTHGNKRLAGSTYGARRALDADRGMARSTHDRMNGWRIPKKPHRGVANGRRRNGFVGGSHPLVNTGANEKKGNPHAPNTLEGSIQ